MPYTGADAFTLTVCIDKAIVKRLWRDAGLPATPVVAWSRTCLGWPARPRSWAATRCSSSRLAKAPLRASRRNRSFTMRPRWPPRRRACWPATGRLLVESYLPGREFSVGVLGSGPAAEALGVVEILHGAAPLVDVLGKKAWAPQTFQPLVTLGCAAGCASSACKLTAPWTVGPSPGWTCVWIEQATRSCWRSTPTPACTRRARPCPPLARLAGLPYADLIGRLSARPWPVRRHNYDRWIWRQAAGHCRSTSIWPPSRASGWASMPNGPSSRASFCSAPPAGDPIPNHRTPCRSTGTSIWMPIRPPAISTIPASRTWASGPTS